MHPLQRRAVVALVLAGCAAALVPAVGRRRRRRALAAKRSAWTWEEAREYARSFGFASEAEYKEYRCPGAYALPSDPVAAYGERWTSWSDFLGCVEVSGRGGFERVLFVEMGWGCDQHGQDPTKAAVRAARNAIEFNSIPSIGAIVPGGYDNMKLGLDVALPRRCHGELDQTQLRAVFPYGTIAFVELQDGGALFRSGIALPAMGDRNDDAIVAIVSVTVGY